MQTNDWQPHLFCLVSDILEEVKDGSKAARPITSVINKRNKSQLGGPPKPVSREETKEDGKRLLRR